VNGAQDKCIKSATVTRKKKERILSFPCERSVSCACPGGKRFKMQLAFAKGKKNQPVEANLHEREEKRKTKNRYR